MHEYTVALGDSAVRVFGLPAEAIEQTWGATVRIDRASRDLIGPGAGPVFTVAAAAGCPWSDRGAVGKAVTLHQKHPGIRIDAAGQTTVVNPAVGSHYHLDSATARNLRICAGDTDPALVDSLQILRGLLLGMEMRAGKSPLHGAVLEHNGRGILLAGPKGAGKTSFTVGALRNLAGCRYVTNDKSVVDDRLRAHALPYSAAVAPGTLSAAPELADGEGRWSDGKLMIWPAAFAARLDCQVTAAVRIDEVWLCSIDLDAASVRIEARPGAEVAARGLEAMTAFSHAMSPLWLFDLLGWTPRTGVPAGLLGLPWKIVTGNPWGSWDRVTTGQLG